MLPSKRTALHKRGLMCGLFASQPYQRGCNGCWLVVVRHNLLAVYKRWLKERLKWGYCTKLKNILLIGLWSGVFVWKLYSTYITVLLMRSINYGTAPIYTRNVEQFISSATCIHSAAIYVIWSHQLKLGRNESATKNMVWCI